MPAKNAVKVYVAGDYYHLYNRGVEKRDVFLDDRDFLMFLHILKRHLDPNYRPQKGERQPKDLSRHIELKAYCLMPNHLHLFVKQLSEYGLEEFTRSVFTAYSMYFNFRYQRVGSLFQGCYKAVRMENNEQYLHIVNYIHANPSSLGVDPSTYSYSSYGSYFGNWSAAWLKPLQGEFLQELSLPDKSRVFL